MVIVVELTKCILNVLLVVVVVWLALAAADEEEEEEVEDALRVTGATPRQSPWQLSGTHALHYNYTV